jgi:hypothetical protein
MLQRVLIKQDPEPGGLLGPLDARRHPSGRSPAATRANRRSNLRWTD